MWIQTATTEYYCLWDIDLHMDECRNGYDLITPGLVSLSFGGSALVWTPARLDPVGFFNKRSWLSASCHGLFFRHQTVLFLVRPTGRPFAIPA